MAKEQHYEQFTGQALKKHMDNEHTYPIDPEDVQYGFNYKETHDRAHQAREEGGDPFMNPHSHKEKKQI